MLSIFFSILLILQAAVSGASAIDVSAHNGNITGLLAKEKPAAVFVRAAYGSFTDAHYTTNSTAVTKSGAHLYAYLFMRPSKVDASPEAQVDHFVKVASAAEGIALDWESDIFITRDGTVGSNGRPPLAELKRAVAEAHRLGLRVGVYASEGAPFPNAGQDWSWVANWAQKPRIHADVWQFAGTTLDRDVVLSNFSALASKPATPAPQVPSTGYVMGSGYPASITVTAGSPILDLNGKQWSTIATTTKLLSAGLVNGHSGTYLVQITTKHFSRDGIARAVWQEVIVH